MIKLLTIFGTRPETIKLAPVIKTIEGYPDKFKSVVCITAQHRKMLDQALEVFDIKPNYDLNIMKNNQNLFDVTVNSLRKLENIIRKERPDLVLVQGDTTTTFAASLAAYYCKVKIGHIEAGLRSDDKFNPFPEEINRRLTDCLADICFAPTKRAKQNLLNEGVQRAKIYVTGNTVIDALLMITTRQKNKAFSAEIERRFYRDYGISIDNRKVILVTVHRRESFGKDIEGICLGIKKIAETNPDIQIILPFHLNPNVKETVKKVLGNLRNVFLINPLDYFSFVWLMSKAYLILTDSGGIQEEAPSLGKPVLVIRNKTERMEGIESGTARLVGADKKKIFLEAWHLLKDEKVYRSMAKVVKPFGDGKASERIIKYILRYFC